MPQLKNRQLGRIPYGTPAGISTKGSITLALPLQLRIHVTDVTGLLEGATSVGVLLPPDDEMRIRREDCAFERP